MPHLKVDPKVNNRPLRIAVLVDTATSWGRGIVTGVQRYSRTQGNWHLFLEPHGASEAPLLPDAWKGSGSIARISNLTMARQLAAQKSPVVNVSGIHLDGYEFPRVCNDIEAVAEMAACYFLARGYRNFAYLGLFGLEYIARQRDAFLKAAASAGVPCSVLGVEAQPGFQSPNWNLKLTELSEWLASLAKPVGLLTFNSGRDIIHACQEAGLRVPDEIAVLSGTDDDLLCACSPIPISGIQSASLQIGYEAASILNELIQGKSPSPFSRSIRPLRIITRQSTDTLAIPDQAVRSALIYIRDHVADPISVAQLAAHAGVSRRVLERRFKQLLERSPADQITEMRVSHVKTLLIGTDLSIEDVSRKSGFNSPEYMTYVFRRAYAMTPLKYRRQACPRDTVGIERPTREHGSI